MANICYTKFKVEGQAQEIERVRRTLNLRESKRLAHYLAYCAVPPLTEAAVQKLTDTASVLSFETATKWGPETGSWTDILRPLAPHAQIIYYAEEFWCGVHETNDIWGKYFPAPYAVYARISEKTPENVREAFTKDAAYRDREDQWGWFSYLYPRELGHRIHDILPKARGCTRDLYAAFEEQKQRLLWEKDTTILIGRIHREKNPMIKNGPCWYCEELNRKQDEISKLYDELFRYQNRFGPLPAEGTELPAATLTRKYPRRRRS